MVVQEVEDKLQVHLELELVPSFVGIVVLQAHVPLVLTEEYSFAQIVALFIAR